MPASTQTRDDDCAPPRGGLPVRASSRPGMQGDGPPTQYPCRPLDDLVLQFQKTLEVAPPAALLDDLPVPAPAVALLLIDRIDAALYERRVLIDCEVYAALLMALLPAEFDIPDPPRPTGTPPKTPGRVRAYAARCKRAVGLFHAADRNGQAEGDSLAVEWGDGRSPRVVGWAAAGNRKRSGTVPGVKGSPRKKAKSR